MVWVYSSSKFIKVMLKFCLISFYYCFNEIVWLFLIDWSKDINILYKNVISFFLNLLVVVVNLKIEKYIYVCKCE